MLLDRLKFSNTRQRRKSRRLPSLSRQRGIALVMLVVGGVVIFGMVGLALDMGYTYGNKTRLQNAVDAAALTGAKVLDFKGSSVPPAQREIDASNAAWEAFQASVEHGGGAVSLFSGTTAIVQGDLTVQFYDDVIGTPTENSSTANPGPYVRVSLANSSATWENWFVRVLPGTGNTLAVSASAMAGPSPPLSSVCNNAFPILLCPQDLVEFDDDDGDDIPDCVDPDGDSDNDGMGVVAAAPDGISDVCDDSIGGSDTSLYGFQLGTQYDLKREPGEVHNGNDTNCNNDGNSPHCDDQDDGPNLPPEDVGPGNFRLLALGAPGGSALRLNFAGAFGACVAPTGDDIQTETGFTNGPTRQGVNTRFGLYSGGQVNDDLHPADTNTCDATYAEYQVPTGDSPCNCSGGVCRRNGDNPNNQRQAGRRIVAMPIGDCSGTLNGRSDLPLIGVACMFLNQPVPTGPDPNVRAELINTDPNDPNASQCPGGGGVVGPPTGGGGNPSGIGSTFTKIVLYQDPFSNDS